MLIWKRLLGPLAAACTATMLSASALARQPAIDRALASEYFQEAKRLSDADDSALWGRPLYGPMLFVDPQSREIVANQADGEQKLTPDDSLFVGTLPDELGVANTAVKWAGVHWTMVMWPVSELPYARGRLLTHELFHRVQDDIGLPASNPANSHLDSKDGRIWLRLEWRALDEALIRSGAQRRRAAEDAIIFRRYRRSLFPGADTEERALEMNEGLAEYTGYRLCGLPAPVLPDRVAQRLEEQSGRAGYGRNFAYLSGPAYGLLLDATNPSWRTGLKPTDDLGDLLSAALALRTPPDPAEAALRARRYDGDRLIAAETQRENVRQERLAGYKRRFVDGPVLVLPLSGEVNYTYDPNGIEAFDDTSSVYRSVRVADAWGILEVSAGAMVIRASGRVSEVRVPAPTDPAAAPLTGDGWTLRLNDGWVNSPGKRPGDLAISKKN
jgi:hypothetical protein